MVVRDSFEIMGSNKVVIIKYKYSYNLIQNDDIFYISDGIKTIYHYYLENTL
jgi:hypothetical protein